MTEKTTFIPARLKSSVVGGHVAGTSDIIDDEKGLTQDVINKETDASIADINQTIENMGEASEKAISDVNAKIDQNKKDADKEFEGIKKELATKQATLEFDNAPAEGSNNPVKSDGIKKALNEKQDKVPGKGLSTEDFTTDEKKKLSDLPNNAELQQAINSKQNNLTFDNVPTDGSANPVRSGGVKTAVDTEAARAKAAEHILEDSIKEETANRKSEDAKLQQEIDEFSGTVDINRIASENRDTNLQSQVDDLRTASGNTDEALAQEKQRAMAAEEGNKKGIEDINAKIPAEASDENQLADKAFVNSSVATNTANYISDGGEPFESFEKLQAYTGVLTNNDYAFVKGTDESGNALFKRYKYSAATKSWALEYVLNNSSFTQSQWNAINSGITALLTQKLDKLPSLEELTALLLLKQDVIKDLDTIRANAQKGSEAYQKPATGIPSSDMTQEVQASLNKADTALQEHQDISGKADKAKSLEGYGIEDAYTKEEVDNKLLQKQDNINDLNEIREGAAKGATALQEHQSLDAYYKKDRVDELLKEKQDNLTIDSTPTVNSNNPISSDAVYDLQEALVKALNGKQNTLTFDLTPTSGSGNPVTSGGVFAAIAEAGQIRFLEVDKLPEPDVTTMGKIYILRQGDSYMWYVSVFDTSLEPPQYVWRQVNNNTVDLSDYYKISQVDALFEALAKVASTGKFEDLLEKPTTIQGYGITDAYTKEKVYNKEETYNKEEVDAELSKKQDTLTFATSTECKTAASELT